MQSKILSRRTLFMVAPIGLVFSMTISLYLVVGSVPKRSTRSQSAPLIKNASASPKPAQVSYGLPARLTIPKINVDAAIEQVGLTSDGLMDAPKGPAEVGWYNKGPRPGETGSAVIDGHSGWKNGIPAAFDNLENLGPGDKITLQDDSGAVISFVVRESRTYAPDADASDVFASNDGKSHLNFITCDGAWDKLAKSHTERLVVFTDKE